MKEVVDVITLRKKIEERSAVERATVARNLKAIRKCKGLSQNQAAELCIGFNVTPYELYGHLVVEIASSEIV